MKTNDLEACLRDLDAATAPGFDQYERAAVTLDRIVATPPDATRRGIRRRWALVPVAAVAVAAGIVALPQFGDGGRAYATWTPVPAPLSPAEVGLVGKACRHQMRGGGHLNLDRAELVLAERRGEYAALLYRADNPEVSGSCLAHNLPGTDDVDDVKAGLAGSSGPAMTAPSGRFTQGALADFREASITDGAVGAGVTGLTVHAGEFTVQATVKDGRWVAWWPGPALEMPEHDSSAEARSLMTYDLTLSDGTVVRDAEEWKGD